MTRIGPRIFLKAQCVQIWLKYSKRKCPKWSMEICQTLNHLKMAMFSTFKSPKSRGHQEVSQMVNGNLPIGMLLGSLSVNLNHLKMAIFSTFKRPKGRGHQQFSSHRSRWLAYFVCILEWHYEIHSNEPVFTCSHFNFFKDFFEFKVTVNYPLIYYFICIEWILLIHLWTSFGNFFVIFAYKCHKGLFQDLFWSILIKCQIRSAREWPRLYHQAH